MLKRIYRWFHSNTSKIEERGEYSSGRWQDMIRTAALRRCKELKGTLLEIGCGEGLFLERVAAENPNLDIYGADTWKEILLKAEKRLNKEGVKIAKLYNARGDKLPFGSEVFDTVVCINVLFNLPSKQGVSDVFKEAGRVCKKGGKIIFDIRNSLNPLLFFKYRFAGFYDNTVKNLPLKTYTLGSILPVLKANNLKVKNKFYIGFPRNIFSPIIFVEAEKD